MFKKPSIQNLRLRLAQSEALPQLTLMALITGLLAGGFLIAFEELLFFFGVVSQRALIPDHVFSTLASVESGYEALPPLVRFISPIGGALALILLIKSRPPKRRSFGIAHVIERLTLNRGWLPITSTITQFFGVLIALVSGFSVGREGPAVHMGAGAGSFLGQILKLPTNTLGVLAGCGTAAAIAALFNTPMAGVIFAMEVVMKEYSLESFIPVMASAVVASVLTQTVYGPNPAFQIPIIPSATPEELAVTAITAVIIGLLAAAFIQINIFAIQKRQHKVVFPLLIAGLLMGIVAVLVPATMGIGYDTIEALLIGDDLNLPFLFTLLATKLVITALVIGLGVPGGMIGPSLMMGATAGACSVLLAEQFLGISANNITFHVMTGMIAMMAAIFQAPLTALITVLELTHSSQIILPAMLAIVIACLTSSQICRQQSIFAMQFMARGQSIQLSPMTQLLNRTGVASLMDSRFIRLSPDLTVDNAKAEISENIQWLVFKKDEQLYILSANTLSDSEAASAVIKIGSLKGLKRAGMISSQASADEALSIMKKNNIEYLLVVTGNSEREFFDPERSGIINRRMIDNLYKDG
ncbi:chloride channel protein [Endozoicomonas atrinae]|uniref:chloride channel protein n=1 Tax=Endozoicomonas atrinae TaxID=1333660 RepID=UPI0008270134|nr:chloride channel protein [Endozoicomonas atrinae]